jgi:hypothetical protein
MNIGNPPLSRTLDLRAILKLVANGLIKERKKSQMESMGDEKKRYSIREATTAELRQRFYCSPDSLS